MIDFDLTGKIALVTGAASGIGLRFAHVLAGQGADLVLIDVKEEQLNQAAEEIGKETGRRCVPILCNLMEEEQINDAVATTMELFGKIDILVNNAGIGMLESTLEHTTANWDKVAAVDLRATFILSREVGKIMRDQGYGRIINTSSMVAFIGGPDQVSYYAMKGGVANMTKAMAQDLGKYNITVNSIAPGLYPGTGIVPGPIDPKSYTMYRRSKIPFGRTGIQGDMDGILLYLASDYSSYTTGQVICVDGGLTAMRW